MSDCFVPCSEEEATAFLEQEQETSGQKISDKQGEYDQVKEELTVLKARIKSKFGDHVNLDDGTELP
uniref:Uncharacterized protein n=1 Tax=Chromera velia CCMP2878 TaxID=1169474 RepID=A0A0G4I6X3_9ALVE|eukprot:Cvel_11443.t1-p1 / transcript=Cvel_11443.t1 / gene=Cvel_11443 / organism=Chromera_velia_CCMP2878 / gene_product=hypothetical protein / transcript_product=hypothetical protein / location=Cvel_scaffold720:945-1142(+) / protein_length=66 / sequence_SO=supercontig / SO=protein_coding / is_pseudo=false